MRNHFHLDLQLIFTSGEKLGCLRSWVKLELIFFSFSFHLARFAFISDTENPFLALCSFNSNALHTYAGSHMHLAYRSWFTIDFFYVLLIRRWTSATHSQLLSHRDTIESIHPGARKNSQQLTKIAPRNWEHAYIKFV